MIRKQGIAVTCAAGAAALAVICGLSITASARVSGGSSLSGGYHYHPAPLTLPAPVPPWFLYGFPHEWTTGEVVTALIDHGVPVIKTYLRNKADFGIMPVPLKELRIFSVPTPEGEVEGYILSFERKDALASTKTHYREMNARGDFYTWSFEKDNILLILPGTIHEEQARQCERALKSLRVR